MITNITTTGVIEEIPPVKNDKYQVYYIMTDSGDFLKTFYEKTGVDQVLRVGDRILFTATISFTRKERQTANGNFLLSDPAIPIKSYTVLAHVDFSELTNARQRKRFGATTAYKKEKEAEAIRAVDLSQNPYDIMEQVEKVTADEPEQEPEQEPMSIEKDELPEWMKDN